MIPDSEYSRPVNVNKGETIDLTITYEAVNLTGLTAHVIDGVPEALNEATLTIIDAPAGKLKFTLDKTNAAKLKLGNLNKFRIELLFPDGRNNVTPPIRVNVI